MASLIALLALIWLVSLEALASLERARILLKGRLPPQLVLTQIEAQLPGAKQT